MTEHRRYSATIRKILAVPLLTGIAAALLTGCGSSGRPTAHRSAVADANAIAPRSQSLTAGLSMPVEAYLFSPDDLALLTRALDTLTTDCMKRQGFTFSRDYEQPPPIEIMDRRYGVANSHTAATYGYHFPSPSSPAPRPAPLSAAERTALTGGQAADGKLKPDGGCVGQSKQKIGQGSEYGPGQVAQDLNTQSFVRSQKDPRVLEVFRKWSACMARHGYTYASPLDAIDDPKFGEPKASAGEITTAVTDVSCKKSTDLVRVWFDVEVEMQTAVVNQDPEKYAAIQENKKNQLKAAAAALR